MEENNGKKNFIKGIVTFVIGGVVETFMWVTTGAMLKDKKCSKLTRMAAKAGALITGKVVAEKVADCVYEDLEESIDTFDKLRAALKNAKEEDND